MRFFSCLLLLIALSCSAHAGDKAKGQGAFAFAAAKLNCSTSCPAGCNCGCADGKECSCNTATISVAAPPDAVIYVDGVPAKTIGKEIRTFGTPKLQPGREYQYEIRVNGETKIVSFKPGQAVKVSFSQPFQMSPPPIYQPFYQTGQVCVGGS